MPELKAVTLLVSNLSNPKAYHTQTITDAEYAVVDKLLSWPVAVVGSGLHLARMLVCHPHAATTYAKRAEKKDGAKDADIVLRLAAIVKEADKAVTALVAARALANCFR